MLQSQETAFNTPFTLSANSESVFARISSGFAAELNVVVSRPVTTPNFMGRPLSIQF